VDNTLPYFSNLDEDAFRSNRFMYILSKPITVFGSKGDVQPPSLAIVRDHCSIRYDGESVVLVPGKGDSFHNGKHVAASKEVTLAIYDRLAMGDQMMMLRWPGKEDPTVVMMTGEEAVEEFQSGLVNSRSTASNQEMLAVRNKGSEDFSSNDVGMSAIEYERAMMVTTLLCTRILKHVSHPLVMMMCR
jgi:hypothetical protein